MILLDQMTSVFSLKIRVLTIEPRTSTLPLPPHLNVYANVLGPTKPQEWENKKKFAKSVAVDDLEGAKHAYCLKTTTKDTYFVRKCMTRLVRKWLPTH